MQPLDERVGDITRERAQYWGGYFEERLLALDSNEDGLSFSRVLEYADPHGWSRALRSNAVWVQLVWSMGYLDVLLEPGWIDERDPVSLGRHAVPGVLLWARWGDRSFFESPAPKVLFDWLAANMREIAEWMADRSQWDVRLRECRAWAKAQKESRRSSPK